MQQRAEEFTQAKSKMIADVKTVIADGEELVKAAAHASGAGLAAARDALDEKISNARTRLVAASRPVIDKARNSAAAADGYVHDHPWTMIGVAAATGAVIGFLIARR